MVPAGLFQEVCRSHFRPGMSLVCFDVPAAGQLAYLVPLFIVVPDELEEVASFGP